MESEGLSKILEDLIQRVEECVLDTASRPNRHTPCLCNKNLAIREIEALISQSCASDYSAGKLEGAREVWERIIKHKEHFCENGEEEHGYDISQGIAESVMDELRSGGKRGG